MKITKYGPPNTPSGYPQITLRDPHTLQEGIHDMVRRLGMAQGSTTGDAVLSGLLITEDSGTGTFASTAGIITTREGYLLEVPATSGSYSGNLPYWIRLSSTALASIPTATGGNVERHFEVTAELIPATSATVIPADCRLLSDYAKGFEKIDTGFLRFGTGGIIQGSPMVTLYSSTFIHGGILYMNISTKMGTSVPGGFFQIFLPDKCRLYFRGWIMGSDFNGNPKSFWMEPFTNNSYKISSVSAGDIITINLTQPLSY